MPKILDKIITAVLVLFFAVNSFALMSKDDVGTTTANFLKLGTGGKANAMGEAVTALVNDSTSVCWNPAGMNYIAKNSISLMHATYIEGMFYDYLTYAQSFGSLGYIGVGVQYFNYGNTIETDALGTELAEFASYDLAFTASYATKLMDIPVGVSVKYIMSKLKNDASAIGFDIGAQLPLIGNSVVLGLLVQNLGMQMTYVDTANNLPMNIKAGLGLKLTNDLSVEVDASLPSDNAVIIGGGLEYQLVFNKEMTIAVRGGYNTRTADTGGINGFTGGIGFKMKDVGLNYALVPYGELGYSHRMSVDFAFGLTVHDEELAEAERQAKLSNLRASIKTAKESGKITLAVMDFVSKGNTGTQAKSVADFVSSSIAKSDRVVIVDRVNMALLVKEQMLQKTGITEAEKAVEVGKMLNVQKIVTGSVEKLGDRYYIDVKVIEVETGKINYGDTKEVSSENELFNGSKDVSNKILESFGK